MQNGLNVWCVSECMVGSMWMMMAMLAMVGVSAVADVEWTMFQNFMGDYNKSYASFPEMVRRFDIWRENYRAILDHNIHRGECGRPNITMAINRFTDWTAEEFRDWVGRGFLSSRGELGSFGCKSYVSAGNAVPDAVDWREKGVVSSVRDQGQCGSCWAFATTANAESATALATGKLMDLSEQMLVDCATGIGYFNMGCNGGTPDSAFKYMIANGQCSESSYPYDSGETKTAGQCGYYKSAASYGACYDVAEGDQVALKRAVAERPVVVAIEADTRYFQSYAGGILTDADKCGTTLDHAVEIVGYGEENGELYWIVRNSWGADWGEEGYVRIGRSEKTNDVGVCGIASEPSFIVSA